MRAMRSQRGLVLVELVITVALLGLLTVPLFHFVRSTLRANQAAGDELALQREAQGILEHIEKSVWEAGVLSDWLGDSDPAALPADPDDPFRTELRETSLLALGADTYTTDGSRLLLGDRVLSPHVRHFQTALLLREAREGTLDPVAEPGLLRGIQASVQLETPKASFSLSRDFLFHETRLPPAGDAPPPSRFLLGDDESYLEAAGLPLHFDMDLLEHTSTMRRSNLFMVFLEPQLTFNASGTSLVSAAAPVVSLQYLSNNGAPGNRNQVRLFVGEYVPSSQGNRISAYVPATTSDRFDLDWTTESLRLGIALEPDNSYRVTLSRLRDTGSQILFSYPTPFRNQGSPEYSFYLGEGFGNGQPQDLRTNNTVGIQTQDPSRSGVFQISYLP